MENEKGNTYVKWWCPECGMANQDIKEQTERPFCGNCETSFSWETILKLEDTEVEEDQ